MASSYWRERSQPYVPGQATPFKVSRSKIELFMQCPRCFWLDVRLKIKRPDGPPFNINKAIDELLKKEFDSYRLKGEPHPMMLEFGVQAIPFQHASLDQWRQNFVGVFTVHQPTNLHVFGAVDDLWVTSDGQLIVVDYKATAKQSDVGINSDWQISYKRQMEVYQWLLRQNGFTVSDTGYFVYTNGRLDLDGFFNKVEFKTKVIPYTGNTQWVEPTLTKMKQCMESSTMPAIGASAMGGPCDFCMYARQRTELTIKELQANRINKHTAPTKKRSTSS
ncbi:MAG TPA: PD-(D/E)XK nuclease family protein [Candidatus Saccharimonadales bacterium]|nr:PD-(D/E)XK nuclease family protein [Candidatus Saccharimonadales bacterium]